MLALGVNDWNSLLGELFFGLAREPVSKYHPTFRSLFSYLVRRDRDAFASPFSHNRAQQEWDKQVNNAFLLGLEWEHAGQLQELKDEENLLNGLRQAAREGLLDGMIGSLGNLEAERARLDANVQSRSQNLNRFRVLPEYEEIEQEVNALTSTIQQLSNANLADGRLADLYRSSLEEDQNPDAEDVLEVYQMVGVTMPELVRRPNAVLVCRGAYPFIAFRRSKERGVRRCVQLQYCVPKYPVHRTRPHFWDRSRQQV